MKKIVKSQWRYEQNLIKEFIEKKLRTDIGYDQKNCKIVGETDLHSCVYSRLQKFFKKNGLENWYIRNEAMISCVKPDLVIAQKKPDKSLHPKFVIELKERKKWKVGDYGFDSDILKLLDLFKESKSKNAKNKPRNSLRKAYFILCLSRSVRDNPVECTKELRDSCKQHQKKVLPKGKNNVVPLVFNAFYDKENRTPTEKFELLDNLENLKIR